MIEEISNWTEIPSFLGHKIIQIRYKSKYAFKNNEGRKSQNPLLRIITFDTRHNFCKTIVIFYNCSSIFMSFSVRNANIIILNKGLIYSRRYNLGKDNIGYVQAINTQAKVINQIYDFRLSYLEFYSCQKLHPACPVSHF